jgi:hypothetical protein
MGFGAGCSSSEDAGVASGRKKLRFDRVMGLLMISATAAARSSSGNFRRFLLADMR